MNKITQAIITAIIVIGLLSGIHAGGKTCNQKNDIIIESLEKLGEIPYPSIYMAG
ncbi:MAG: hypothetical protein GY868_03635 [Deltaproteobacteria bacterium]|nr:hypothetical protein [Deltaproteobacteria bacterium]